MKLVNQYDFVGVGIGPANLSLAALSEPLQQFDYCFFDCKSEFSWHVDTLFSQAEIQVNYLQDLVTLVDPTNPYSFVAYLAKHKRLYRFIYSHFNMVLRKEFADYLHWVSQSLDHLQFGETVYEINFNDNYFLVETDKTIAKSKHIILGNGLSPYIPPAAKPHLNANVFHSKDFLKFNRSWKNKRIAVVGGGQSAAEIIQQLIANENDLPYELNWITRRSNILPLDESSFTNELFTPAYVHYFHDLPPNSRKALLNQQTLASDGISAHLIDAIYQRLYALEFIEKVPRFTHFYLDNQLEQLTKSKHTYQLLLSNQQLLTADIIILCTGYHWQYPDYLLPLRQLISMQDNQLLINKDYSLIWNGPKQNRIYIQNGAKHTHGVADPNLCLMAWRSASIINSIAEKSLYDIEDDSTVIHWDQLSIKKQYKECVHV